MKNLSFPLGAVVFLCCLVANFETKANDTLIAIIDDKLIAVNQNDAGYSEFTTLIDLPSGNLGFRLSWSDRDQCFYTLSRTVSNPGNEIAKIDLNGQYTTLGALDIPGSTVYFIEGISYSNEDNFIYLSASLDGDMPNDYWSESILKVDPLTLAGTVVGQIAHTGFAYQEEADMIEVIGNTIYYIDSEGNGSMNKVYSQDLDFNNSPVLLFDDPNYANSSSLTVKGDDLFYTVGKELRKIDLNTLIHTVIGDVYTNQFSSSAIYGIDWLPSGFGSLFNQDSEIYTEIYPNPTTDIINIKIDSDESGKILIYDMNGKLILEDFIYNRYKQISLANFASGTYNLTVQLNKRVVTKRVVVN